MSMNPSCHLPSFTSYAVLGSGRVARHFQHYFKSLNLPTLYWSRNGAPEFNSSSLADPRERLSQILAQASHIVLAIKDSAIGEFASLRRPDQTFVHLSGALFFEDICGAHPLMTFGPRLEDLPWYRSIPFVVDQGHKLAELLPGLPNAEYPIASKDKPLYHALCALAGNSTYTLLGQIGDQMENRLGLSRELLEPFLRQIVRNASLTSSGALTGPVARGDWAVVRTHLETLPEELKRVYANYLSMARGRGIEIPTELLS